jgi:transposase
MGDNRDDVPLTLLHSRGWHEEEIADRVEKVRALRIRHMSATEIARHLKVGVHTICDDIERIRHGWRDKYGGAQPQVNAAEIVGESLDLYRECERLGLQNHASATDGRTKAMHLRVVMEARSRHVALLQDLGYIDRNLGTLELTLPTAADLRKRLADAQVTEAMLTPAIDAEVISSE